MPSSHSRKGALIHAKACRAPFGDCCAGFVVCKKRRQMGQDTLSPSGAEYAPTPISYPDNVWQEIPIPPHHQDMVVSEPSELADGYDK